MKITALFRAISSAGSEHLVYTEGVGGSNPSSPTRQTPLEIMEFFYVLTFLKPLSDKMVNSQDYAMRLFSSNTYLSAHHLHKVQFRNAETVRQMQSHLLL
jgi:hypothetical protein